MKKGYINLKLLPKFAVSLTILGVILSIAISLFSYINTRSYLEMMYAQRVVFGAQSIASMIAIEDVKEIIAPNGDQSEAYTKTVELFNRLKKDGEITFLSLTIPDDELPQN